MIQSIAWRTLLLAVLIIVTGLQLDRQVRKTPSLAENVPVVFRSAAQFPVAAHALAKDDPQNALKEAERLVARRPLPAEHLRLLAQAHALANNADESTITIQYAARRGWRDPLAQEAMLRLALSAGDTAEAARRLAALMVQGSTDDQLIIELANRVFEEPQGEAIRTIAEIVAGADSWRSRFLNRGARTLPSDAFLEIVQSSVDLGAELDCPSLQRAIGYIGQPDLQQQAAIDKLLKDAC